MTLTTDRSVDSLERSDVETVYEVPKTPLEELAMPPFPEAGNPLPDDKPGKLRRAAAGLALAATIGGGGAVGAAAGMSVPSYVDIAGFNGQLSLRHTPYSRVNLGVLGAFRAPKLSAAGWGVNADLQPSSIGDPNLSYIANLFSNNGENIERPIVMALLKRAGEGAAAGAAIGFLAGSALILDGAVLLDERKKRKATAKDKTESVNAGPPPGETIAPVPVPDVSLRKPDPNRRKKARLRATGKLGVAALITALGIGTVLGAHAGNPPADAPSIETPLNPSLANLNPILQGGTVEGDIGTYIPQIMTAVEGQKNGIQLFWSTDGAEVAAQLTKLADRGKLLWLSDPNTTAFLDGSDFHGNMPFMDEYLPRVIQAGDINTLVFTGDLYNASDVPSSFLDKIAQPMEHLKSLVVNANKEGRKLQVVFISGNHDPLALPAEYLALTLLDQNGKPYHPFIQLNEMTDYHTTIDGITYVGTGDENRTTDGPDPTVPDDRDEQIQNDFEQGMSIADVACKIKDEMGKAPVVAMHEWQATVQTALKGCGELLLSGHRHVDEPLMTFRDKNGNLFYLRNIGSASGSGPGELFRPYAKASVPGSMVIYTMNKATGQMEQMVTITVHPYGEPTITVKNAPKPKNAPEFSQETVDEINKLFAPND